MKYAIVEISGRQFWIETGKYYDFNRILQIINKLLKSGLLSNNDGDVLIGKPYLESVKVRFRAFKKKTIVYKCDQRRKEKTRSSTKLTSFYRRYY
jgi:large subunit ribosomal protein L21